MHGWLALAAVLLVGAWQFHLSGPSAGVRGDWTGRIAGIHAAMIVSLVELPENWAPAARCTTLGQLKAPLSGLGGAAILPGHARLPCRPALPLPAYLFAMRKKFLPVKIPNAFQGPGVQGAAAAHRRAHRGEVHAAGARLLLASLLQLPFVLLQNASATGGGGSGAPCRRACGAVQPRCCGRAQAALAGARGLGGLVGSLGATPSAVSMWPELPSLPGALSDRCPPVFTEGIPGGHGTGPSRDAPCPSVSLGPEQAPFQAQLALLPAAPQRAVEHQSKLALNLAEENEALTRRYNEQVGVLPRCHERSAESPCTAACVSQAGLESFTQVAWKLECSKLAAGRRGGQWQALLMPGTQAAPRACICWKACA